MKWNVDILNTAPNTFVDRKTQGVIYVALFVVLV